MGSQDEVTRRAYLQLAAAMGASLVAGCGPSLDLSAGGDAGSDADGDAGKPAGKDSGTIEGADADAASKPLGAYRSGVASFANPGLRRAAVRRAVELAGGMPWLKSGD